MAEELNDSIAYLKALRQMSGSQDAAAAAPGREPQVPGAAAQVGERFEGAEKRRSPRYKCEGSAEMREEGCDVRTWASFSDVSLHGCYIEAQATYPVGTVLHLKLETNGVRVETQGTVRVAYPYLGMGIAFTEESDEIRSRLRELLATVSHGSAIMGPAVGSTALSCAPMDAVPAVSNPAAAMQALIDFFQTRHLLTRDDFLQLVAKSQNAEARR
jgi:hypothetical protein